MLAGSPDCQGGDCPEVYATDRGTALVRGYKVTDDAGRAEVAKLGIPTNEDVVEVPLDLLRTAVAHAS